MSSYYRRKRKWNRTLPRKASPQPYFIESITYTYIGVISVPVVTFGKWPASWEYILKIQKNIKLVEI